MPVNGRQRGLDPHLRDHEVDALPPQPEQLASAHPGAERDPPRTGELTIGAADEEPATPTTGGQQLDVEQVERPDRQRSQQHLAHMATDVGADHVGVAAPGRGLDAGALQQQPLVEVTPRSDRSPSGESAALRARSPDDKGFSGDAEGTPVADIRYLTCVDKTALDHLAVETLRPLTGPQRARFQRWLSRRFARTANDDMVERDVLTEAGNRIRSLAKSFVAAKDVTPTMRMVAAAEEW